MLSQGSNLDAQRRSMQDFINLVMLVCASLASMSLGVWAAYAICKGGFALMRWHTGQTTPTPVQPSTEVVNAS
jgi:hypothetical protein